MNNAPLVSSSSSRLHVVLGAGQIGPRVADLLLAQGHRVRLVQRTRRAPERPGLTSVCGDITDLAFAEEATRGASVVYDCMSSAWGAPLASRSRWRDSRASCCARSGGDPRRAGLIGPRARGRDLPRGAGWQIARKRIKSTRPLRAGRT